MQTRHSTVRKLVSIPFEGAGAGLSFFLGDLEVEGPDTPTDELSLHLHAGDVVFMARLTEKLTRVIVALHSEQNGMQDRKLSIEDFQNAIDKAGVHVKIRSAEWMTPFHVNDLQARHYRARNVFLAGDAAHIHSPVGGQGMNTGIQDAANLAWKLVAVGRGGDVKLLDSYEEERGAVGQALLRFTRRGLKLATASNRLVGYLRDALVPLLSKPKVVQNAFVGFITETAIEYRSSSIVSDYGGNGDLKAGDRLPDLEIAKSSQPSTLLHDWTDGRHLAVLMNPSDVMKKAVADRLKSATVISLSDQDLNDEGRRLLGSEKTLLIIRPDGYIGFRGPQSKSAELDAYARQDGLNDSRMASTPTEH